MSDQTIAAQEIEAFIANLPGNLRTSAAIGGGTLHLSAAGCIALAARLDAVSRKIDDLENLSDRGAKLVARVEAEKVAYFRDKFWNEIIVWMVVAFGWSQILSSIAADLLRVAQ